MQASDALQIFAQCGIAMLFFYLFVFVGTLLTKRVFQPENGAKYTWLFWNFLLGLIIVICLYSIMLSRGVTINLLLLPLLFFLGRSQHAALKKLPLPIANAPANFCFFEVALVAFVSVMLLHIFPESEYKQADSFFYLKIAESLNATGQENISHYANQLDNTFYGAEPYHYFELWLTAFIIRFTQNILPSIQVQRFISQAIILTGIIVGLYMVAEVVLKEKLRLAHKFFCWSLLFIMPNILGYFPWLYHVFVSDFEGNALDRPNFRIIYLLLVPVVNQVYQQKSLTRISLFWLLILSVVSFQFAVVFLPGLLLYGVILFIKKDKSQSFIWWPTLAFIIGMAVFYAAFSPTAIPSFVGDQGASFLTQTLKGYKFILFSIVTSFLYILLIFSIFLLPLYLYKKQAFKARFKKLWPGVLLIFCIVFSGVALARTFYLKDNAYQFIFIPHLLVTIIIWFFYLSFEGSKSPRFYWLATLFLSAMWFVHWFVSTESRAKIFKQNGRYVYEGKHYSAQYMAEVEKYFKAVKPVFGGYFADTSFYKDLYYSRRNPNVYFLPVTYIIAGRHNCNVEICLSDTNALQIENTNRVFKDYLSNAISRSAFYKYRSQHKELPFLQQVSTFIVSHKLGYVITTKNVDVGFLRQLIKKEIQDPNTGERFLILQ